MRLTFLYVPVPYKGTVIIIQMKHAERSIAQFGVEARSDIITLCLI